MREGECGGCVDASHDDGDDGRDGGEDDGSDGVGMGRGVTLEKKAASWLQMSQACNWQTE